MRGRVLFIAATMLGASGAAAAADEPPLCADRPGKASPTCSVPAGMILIETGLADWARDRSSGVTTDSLALASTAFKYGLSSRWNFELDVTPYNSLRTTAAGLHQSDSGFGDLVLRSKYRFTGGEGFQVAMNPAVKVPTAKQPIGNGRWEAGVAFPIDYSIPKSTLSVTLGPEIDWLADQVSNGHHIAMAQVIGLGWQVTRKLNLSAELWGQWNWDPAGTVRQTTADAAVAYLVNSSLQLDAGANFGLNRNSPDAEIYSGISVRF
jgi:hypothetical protein